MATSKNIRWGMIGCGEVTEVKSGPAYQKTAGFCLHGVMRRNEALAHDYAARHKVEKVYTTAEALINDPDIDAVYIATPPDSHKNYALMVAAANKPCCIEKPLAPNYSDCLAIVNAFEQAGAPLFVAYYRRSLPRFEQVKTLLQQGSIGQIRRVHWEYSCPPSQTDLKQRNNWRTQAAVARGGYFDDLASHGLDFFAYVLGDFKSATGYALNQQGLYSAYDAVTACWLHESGVTGTGSWNFGSFKAVDEVVIVGSQGEIQFSVFHDNPVIVRDGQTAQSFTIAHPQHVQMHYVEAIRDSLLNASAHPSTGQTALHTSWVMEEILG